MRQLHGEDLDRLAWVDPVARARSLGEAQRLVGSVDEFDYLAAYAGDRLVGIGAAGYRTPFGDASLVSLTVDPELTDTGPHRDPLRVLLARLEQRARQLTCLSAEVSVDADDDRGRAALERLGYGLVRATTTAVPGPQPGTVDGWVLRKDLGSGLHPMHQSRPIGASTRDESPHELR